MIIAHLCTFLLIIPSVHILIDSPICAHPCWLFPHLCTSLLIISPFVQITFDYSHLHIPVDSPICAHPCWFTHQYTSLLIHPSVHIPVDYSPLCAHPCWLFPHLYTSLLIIPPSVHIPVDYSPLCAHPCLKLTSILSLFFPYQYCVMYYVT